MKIDPELASWLQLSLTPGLGSSSLRKLLHEFGLPRQVLSRRRSELAAFIGSVSLEALDSTAVRQAVERALDWAGGAHHSIVTLADEMYPRTLLEIADPPPLLYAHGGSSCYNARRSRSSAAATPRRKARATPRISLAR